MPNPNGGLNATNAIAAGQCGFANPESSSCAGARPVRLAQNCNVPSREPEVCVGIKGGTGTTFVLAYGCAVCEQGYEAVEGRANYNGCAVPVTICRECTKTCSNCTSDTTFSAAGTGYMKKVTRTCDTCTGTCTATTTYQCAANYYGSSTNGTSGCSPCPTSGKSPAGSTAATGCYITSGTDTSGAFNFDGTQCYYK